MLKVTVAKAIYRAESLAELVFCKLLIVVIPFRFWSRLCGLSQCESLREDVGSQRHRIVTIQRSISWAAARVPWTSKCLDKAMAAQRMLARRGLRNTIYFGMLKDEHAQWTAHAWVRCGDQWVVGYQEGHRYTVVGTFAKLSVAT